MMVAGSRRVLLPGQPLHLSYWLLLVLLLQPAKTSITQE